MRRAVVLLLVTGLLALWPLGSAHSSQPTPDLEPPLTQDFNGDSIPDLAIAAPDETLGGAEAAGVVHVLLGSAAGVTSTGCQLWSQDSPGVEGTAEQGDFFGDVLMAGPSPARAAQPPAATRMAAAMASGSA